MVSEGAALTQPDIEGSLPIPRPGILPMGIQNKAQALGLWGPEVIWSGGRGRAVLPPRPSSLATGQCAAGGHDPGAVLDQFAVDHAPLLCSSDNRGGWKRRDKELRK